jgi:PAS domain S-box-containing protein
MDAAKKKDDRKARDSTLSRPAKTADPGAASARPDRDMSRVVSLLRDSDERFRVIVASVKDYAIFMVSPTGHIETWNRGAELIKGYQASEVIGKRIDVFYPPEDRARGKADRLLQQAERDGRVEDEGWRVRKDGTRFWADVVITALRSEDGKLLGFSKVTRDLTERRRLEEERLQRVRAEEALRVRDEFLSIASHELKTPLTSLQLELYAMRERLKDAVLDERLSLKLDRAWRNADRLAGLIDTLLDVSRLATGRLTLKRTRFDLVQSVRQVVDGMRRMAARAECELVLELADPAPAIDGVWDRLRVEQVLMNLIANALKYGAGRPVTVALAADDREVVMQVRDQGPGVAAEDAERIFERFERASPVRHYGGLGLGLYVSREIVRAEHGTIAARNLPGGGACFEVRLPIERPPDAGGQE